MNSILDVFYFIATIVGAHLFAIGLITIFLGIIAMVQYDDPFHFIRTRTFHNMLKKSKYQNLTGLLHFLFKTKKSDWTYKNGEMILSLNEIYSVSFTYHDTIKSRLAFYYQKVKVAEVSAGFNGFAYFNFKNHIDEFLISQVFSHLTDTQLKLEGNAYVVEKKQVHREEIEKEMVYVHVTEQTNTPKAVKTINPEPIQKLIQRTLEEMEVVLQHQKWLSFEDVYLLKETFPNDLNELIHAYNEVTDKQKAEQLIHQSISVIQEKLALMREKIEQNKENNLLQRVEVIKRR